MAKDQKMIKRLFNNLKFNLNTTVYFEMIYKLACLLFFVPINYIVLNRFLKDIGATTVSNKDLIKLALNSYGAIYLILIMIISFIALFIEVGILTFIADKSHRREKAGIIEAVVNVFGIFPGFPSLYMVLFILLAGIIGPFTGTGLCSSLVSRFTIPAFIKLAIFNTSIGKTIYYCVLAVLVLFLMRWILSIPVMVVENVSFKKAFRKARNIYRKNRMKIFLYMLLWIGLSYVVRFIFLGGVAGLTTLILGWCQSNYELSSFTMSAGIVVFFIIYMTFSMVLVPLFMSFLIEIYYELRKDEAEDRIFISMDYYKDRKIYRWAVLHRRRIIGIVSVLFLITSSSMGLSTVINNAINKDVVITAHRGSSQEAPENSISALKQSISDGADYMELDVRLTSDGEVVVFHDGSLKRMTGISNSIENMTFNEVREVNLGRYCSDKYDGEKIPTLKEMLRGARNKIKLNIELKTVNKDETLPLKVVELIKEFNMEDQIVVQSQDYDSLQVVKDNDPLISVGFILTLGFGDYSKLNVDFVSVEYQMLKKDLVYSMHALGKEVYVWTLNDKKKIENAIKLGADNIITDSVKTSQQVSSTVNRKEDIDYISKFYDGIYSIMNHVKI